MQTIKIKTTEQSTIEIEREIQVPAYFKNDFTVYRIESATKATSVHIFGITGAHIDLKETEYKIKEVIGNYKPATEEEFLIQIGKALAMFYSLEIEKVLESMCQ